MIEVRNIDKIYGKKTTAFKALDDVSFDIESGSSVAILGKSGSGKSTLMHIISGLDKPQSGQVLIDGKDILKLKESEMDKFRANQMSFVFQSFYIQGNETCYDNVSLALETAGVARSRRPEMIKAALEAVELGDKIKQKAKNLSGGQKQRLAVARAIVARPKILFADEPTGNLDSKTGQVVEDLLFNYCQKTGATLIIVTHDEDLARRCDKVILVKDGKVVE